MNAAGWRRSSATKRSSGEGGPPLGAGGAGGRAAGCGLGDARVGGRGATAAAAAWGPGGAAMARGGGTEEAEGAEGAGVAEEVEMAGWGRAGEGGGEEVGAWGDGWRGVVWCGVMRGAAETLRRGEWCGRQVYASCTVGFAGGLRVCGARGDVVTWRRRMAGKYSKKCE